MRSLVFGRKRMKQTFNVPSVIGVKNSKVKKWLADQPPIQIIQISPETASYDCIRHIDFLKYWKYDRDNFRKSIYWRYMVRAKGSDIAADEKCLYFGSLFDAICNNGWNGSEHPIAITDDGVRLDGSHRSAIAKVLGIQGIHARIYSWKQVSFFSKWEAKKLQQEAVYKRYIYDAAKINNNRVISRKNNLYLGRFIHVETRLQDFSILPTKHEFIVMIESPDGDFLWVNWNDVQLPIEKLPMRGA